MPSADLPDIPTPPPPRPPPSGAARNRHPIPDESWPTANEAEGSLLFSPLRLASGLELQTRSWVPAMVPWRATNEGFVTPQVIDWYRRFAVGRPGVIVVEATGIRDVPSGPLLRIGNDRFVPGLRDLARAVADASDRQTRLLIQCIDFMGIRRRPEPRRFFERYLALRDAHREAVAAHDARVDVADDDAVRAALLAGGDALWTSALDARELESLRRGHRERVTDVHLPHVAELPEVLPTLFGDAARRARDAGFDGVELHYAHAYTMASFLSRTNARDDGYGTTLEGRVRLPLEVYRAVRDEVGADFTVATRFLGDEVIEGGSRLADAVWFAERFAEAGFDALSISRGGKFEDAAEPKIGAAVYPYTGPSGHACMPTVFGDRAPFGVNLELAAAIRRAVRDAGHTTPIVGAGGINGFAVAEGALQRGDIDLVGSARQTLADPDWFAKTRAGRGAEVVRCIYTNYCEALDQRHEAVTCQLWDRWAPHEGDAKPLAEGPVDRSSDGRRRLIAPPEGWRPTRSR